MTVYKIIKNAIENSKCVTLTFDGYKRNLAPHILGSKKGEKSCLFYQYSGSSKSGLSKNIEENWRCLPISKIKNIEINSDEFVSAPNYSKSQTCIDKIDVKVIV